MSVTFTIVIPTKGRDTLARTLASVAPQLEHGDEVIVERLDCSFGNDARERAMLKAEGSHLLFIDDDDVYTDGALAVIRDAVGREPDRVHVFQMRYSDGRLLWDTPSVYCGNVGSPMFCVPNQPGRLGSWGDTYEGDFNFLHTTLQLRGDLPVFHQHVVALIRPGLDCLVEAAA
jgi:glycosyltransferase involved in cell wall biosynthesis